LVRTDGYAVGLDNFARDRQYRKTVAISFPDFNQQLFPAYDLLYHFKYIRNDFVAIPVSMLVNGMIAEEDGDPEFIAGNDELMYMTLTGGKKFAARKQDGGWVVTPVADYREAEAFIRENSRKSNPPLFIVKQE